MDNLDWFHSLNSPVYSPPDWIFMPVWTILYIFIGISLYLFIQDGFSKGKTIPLLFFALQLFFNFMWSIIFFSWQNIFLAFIDVVLLLITIIITIFMFYKYSKLSAYFLIPYLLWVFFATILNFGYLILN